LTCSTARRADSLWEIGFNPPKSPLNRGEFCRAQPCGIRFGK